MVNELEYSPGFLKLCKSFQSKKVVWVYFSSVQYVYISLFSWAYIIQSWICLTSLGSLFLIYYLLLHIVSVKSLISSVLTFLFCLISVNSSFAINFFACMRFNPIECLGDPAPRVLIECATDALLQDFLMRFWA